jgi:DDE domain
MDLFVSSGGFQRRHDRLSPDGQTGRGFCQALFPEGIAVCWPPSSAGDQHAWESILPEGYWRAQGCWTTRTTLRCRPVRYLNNIVEQDHRAIKRRVRASQGFRSFDSARRTIQGIETVNMIRKGQVRWLPKDDIVGQMAFVAGLFGLTDVA